MKRRSGQNGVREKTYRHRDNVAAGSEDDVQEGMRASNPDGVEGKLFGKEIQ